MRYFKNSNDINMQNLKQSDIVKLTGLSRTEWNDESAEIIGKIIEKEDGTKRWPIRILKNDKTALIKEENLVYMSPAFIQFPKESFERGGLTENAQRWISDINAMIKAVEPNLRPFDLEEYQMVFRALPGLDNYYVVYQHNCQVLAILAMVGDIKLEFIGFELEKGGLLIVYGYLKDGLERYLKEKGITVPWL